MHSIPPRVLEQLADEPPVVVAPVGLGFVQADLERWAQQTKRRVLRNLSELTPGVKALVMPSSRSQLANLPTGLEPEQVLFLQETDLLFSLEEWQQALEPETGWRVTQAYLETGGWPEGLALARSFIAQGIQGPLARHPQCAARLGSLLPRDISHETLVRLAQSPVLFPEVYGLLGLDENQVATLYDRGLLYAQGAGLALPRLLRLYLRGPIPTETVDALEATLRDHGHTDAALELLAEHGLWERYLWLLTETFAADRGERYLRPLLRLVPPGYRSQPTYRYLNTFLARFVGDTESMARTLEALLPLADDRLKPYVLNAYGVSFGMKAKYAQAAAVFQQALGELPEAASKIKADLLHNLGLAWYYLGNLRMARELFIRSSALCCELGLYDQEAANLISLSSLENSLGNPQAALAAVERALPHLADGTSKLHLAAENRANAMLMMGDLPGAEAKLLALPKRPHDRRVQLIVKLALGYVGLWKGNYRAALSMAEEILQCGFDDQHLISEAHLLLSKIAYQKGQPALAKTHLSKVEQDYRAMAEAAWQGLADLHEAVADMRQRGAKFELAQLLLRKGGLDSLREALVLCQTHGYGLLLQHRLFAPYWRALVLADNESRRAFPLRLQTFGAFSAELLGVRCNLAEGFRTRKAALLLIFLALHPGPHSRERLAEVFWSDTSSPLASLNTAISDLRRLFKAPLIEGNKRQVWLGFPVSSDLEEFVQASEPYLKQPLPAQPNDLEALLSRFALEWLPEFADWFAEERSALEARQAKLWRRLAEHYRRSAPHKALGAYRRVVRLEPYDAETWNELATLYQALGEPALAQQALAAMRKALGELDSSLLRPA